MTNAEFIVKALQMANDPNFRPDGIVYLKIIEYHLGGSVPSHIPLTDVKIDEDGGILLIND